MNLDQLIEALLQLRRESCSGQEPVTLRTAVPGMSRATKVSMPGTMGYSKPGERYILIS